MDHRQDPLGLSISHVTNCEPQGTFLTSYASIESGVAEFFKLGGPPISGESSDDISLVVMERQAAISLSVMPPSVVVFHPITTVDVGSRALDLSTSQTVAPITDTSELTECLATNFLMSEWVFHRHHRIAYPPLSLPSLAVSRPVNLCMLYVAAAIYRCEYYSHSSTHLGPSTKLFCHASI
ncbi:hypothetical protein EGR_10606 [Echinococcus granulosus]|uniref:Uncharacterized protein n=1 Tax=Echinococcus granulosus TaxID=6210 RepID=W6U0H8_ECHGR|nr:hypothetical protein EGR_10606 [Echinococcus granulosus]EUB54538.1 hypothetical protein EGR_10606 [Echinococcus granulosus]